MRAIMRPVLATALTAALGLVGIACGDLDDVTTVKDLRVLAVRSEPAGILVDLDHPEAIPQADLNATLTALVVDPLGNARTLTYTAAGCPDYLDTITAATGTQSKLCPSPDATSQLPEPIGAALTTTIIIPAEAPASVSPDQGTPTSLDPPIEYYPQTTFGLTPSQIGLFFLPGSTGIPIVDQSIAYNRDFGLDAIVNLYFTLGDESAAAIKRVVYWPRLTADQQPNHNPEMNPLRFFKRRNLETGDPEDEWPENEIPTVSISAEDELYVLPSVGAVQTPGGAEQYLLRVKNTQTMQIETVTIDRELLVYQFYATAGTFLPDQRQSELSPIYSSPDGQVHVDGQYVLPKPEDRPADGKVTIWVTVRDERTGTGWAHGVIQVDP
jgi:hypothetical protein